MRRRIGGKRHLCERDGHQLGPVPEQVEQLLVGARAAVAALQGLSQAFRGVSAAQGDLPQPPQIVHSPVLLLRAAQHHPSPVDPGDGLAPWDRPCCIVQSVGPLKSAGP